MSWIIRSSTTATSDPLGLNGAKRSLRSLHVYANGAETVVDCIGPVGDAKAFTATICDPVIASLDLG